MQHYVAVLSIRSEGALGQEQLEHSFDDEELHVSFATERKVGTTKRQQESML